MNYEILATIVVGVVNMLAIVFVGVFSALYTKKINRESISSVERSAVLKEIYDRLIGALSELRNRNNPELHKSSLHLVSELKQLIKKGSIFVDVEITNELLDIVSTINNLADKNFVKTSIIDNQLTVQFILPNEHNKASFQAQITELVMPRVDNIANKIRRAYYE